MPAGIALGDITIARVIEMISPFDKFEFFPNTTPADWHPYLDALAASGGYDHATGALLFPLQTYVVRTRHHTILIDTCIGNCKQLARRPDWDQRADDRYLDALAAQGVRPEDVDYVMCTHLHADHVGWNTQRRDGRWVPTFPNARYVMSAKEVALAQAMPEPPAPIIESVLPVVAAGQAQLVEADFALDDSVSLLATPGHTPGHFAVVLSSGARRAVMTGDMMHTPVQCHHPEWAARPDWDAVMASATRRDFLERHCETATLVCTAHFPLPSIGRIERAGDAFAFRPLAD